MREIIFSSVIGSKMYGCATDKSDTDVRGFVMPAFEDFFDNTYCLDQINDNKVDSVLYDIRKFPSYVYNTSPIFLDILYSNEIIISDNPLFKNYMKYILSKRDEIAKINLKKLYYSCSGMFFKNMKMLELQNENNKEIFDKYGYNIKCFMICFRIARLLNAIKNNIPLEDVILLRSADERKRADRVINGEIKIEQAREILDLTNKEILESKSVFVDFPVNDDLYNEINERTKTFVKCSFAKKLVDEILNKESNGGSVNQE